MLINLQAFCFSTSLHGIFSHARRPNHLDCDNLWTEWSRNQPLAHSVQTPSEVDPTRSKILVRLLLYLIYMLSAHFGPILIFPSELIKASGPNGSVHNWREASTFAFN